MDENITPSLVDLEEDLMLFGQQAEKTFEEQIDEINKAQALDKKIRSLAKRLEGKASSGLDKKIKIDLLQAVYELSQLRRLGRKSFYKFIAIKEAFEALVYDDACSFIYNGSPKPRLRHLLHQTFGDRRDEVFSRPEYTASITMAIVEAVGEISKGIRSVLQDEDWDTNEVLCEKYIATCRRALKISRTLIAECKKLGEGYSEQLDKFFRRLIVIMDESILKIGECTMKLQLNRTMLRVFRAINSKQ